MYHSSITIDKEALRLGPKAEDGLEVFLCKYLSSIVTFDFVVLSDPLYNLYSVGTRNNSGMTKDLKDVLGVF